MDNRLIDDQTADLFNATKPVAVLDPYKNIDGAEEILKLLKYGEIQADPRFQLKNEAYLLKLAYANNKLLSLSNSRTKILAHQVESTYVVVNTLNHRYILADEVGLGKTVEAGLVIKELVYRFNYKRIMVAAPASLLVQWQLEMDEKFGEKFEVLDRKVLEKRRREMPAGENPWNSFEKIICSLDFIKNPAFREELEATQWDAIIFDEAHRLRRDGNSTTIIYTAAEMLSERTKAMLLLTATPFRGKLEELYYIVRLVDKNLLGPYQSFYNEYCTPDSDLSSLKEKLGTVLLRRTKNEIGGFTKRHARTIRFDLYAEERELYDETSRYVAEEFNRAMQTQNRAVGFIMTVFQKLLDSSSHALHCALCNRKRSLEVKLERADKYLQESEEFEALEFDDLRDDIEDESELCDEAVQKTAAEIRLEIQILENLIELSGSITRNKKGDRLKKMIHGLKKEGRKKFLIFTQFRTTQDYLKRILTGLKVEVFNGSMDKDAKERAIDNFKGDVEVLICTEAGGEGRNMQFCNVLFNYDLPWSPLKIEQRIGRLHRFGQQDDVYIYNFATKDTVAERILDVLEHKLHLFEESIGPPDIMLGQIEDELNLGSLFMKIRSGLSAKNESLELLDSAVCRAKKSFEKLSSLTLTRRMDFNYDEYYRITQSERRFSNEQLENFMVRFAAEFPDFGFTTTKSGAFYPLHTQQNSEIVESKGTFDSDLALSNPGSEFLAFGHPMVDSAIEDALEPDFAGLTSVKIINADKNFEGVVFTFNVHFKAVSVSSEYIPVFVSFNKLLDSFDIEEVEDQFLLKPDKTAIFPEQKLESTISRLVPYGAELFSMAVDRLRQKITDKVFDMKENLDLQIDPEIEKVTESYRKQINELREVLSRQELAEKTSGGMKSALGRTKNRIEHAEKEKRHLLAKYKRYSGVSYTISAVGALVLLGRMNSSEEISIKKSSHCIDEVAVR
ncbi:MAG: SNF2-related protein [Spirochaetes bacterium]|nr:SNF2-related protein [Spirochaetota bacterium]